MARKPFTAVPLKAVRKRPRKARGERWFAWVMVALPLAAFTAVFTYGGPPPGAALEMQIGRASCRERV